MTSRLVPLSWEKWYFFISFKKHPRLQPNTHLLLLVIFFTSWNGQNYSNHTVQTTNHLNEKKYLHSITFSMNYIAALYSSSKQPLYHQARPEIHLYYPVLVLYNDNNTNGMCVRPIQGWCTRVKTTSRFVFNSTN